MGATSVNRNGVERMGVKAQAQAPGGPRRPPPHRWLLLPSMVWLAALATAAAAEDKRLVSISMTVSNDSGQQGKRELWLHSGEDPEHAAFKHAARHNLKSESVMELARALADEVQKEHGRKRVLKLPLAKYLKTNAAHAKRGREHLKAGRLVGGVARHLERSPVRVAFFAVGWGRV